MRGSSRHEDFVFVLNAQDAEVYEFSTYVEQPDGSLLIGDYLECDQTFYRPDGERLSPVCNSNGTVDRLRPTGERAPSELRAALERCAAREGLSWDNNDPMDQLRVVRRREYADRWPRWPKWLDQWMHGPRI